MHKLSLLLLATSILVLSACSDDNAKNTNDSANTNTVQINPSASTGQNNQSSIQISESQAWKLEAKKKCKEIKKEYKQEKNKIKDKVDAYGYDKEKDLQQLKDTYRTKAKEIRGCNV